MLGYKADSSRSRPHRQSGIRVSSTQTGMPRAPAKCAGAESNADDKIKRLHRRRGVCHVGEFRTEVDQRHAIGRRLPNGLALCSA